MKVQDEASLQNLPSLPWSEVRPEFKEQVLDESPATVTFVPPASVFLETNFKFIDFSSHALLSSLI